jgi:hypothetical protein
MQLDDAESMDLKIGLFATAQTANPVPESAFPALVRFAKVRVAWRRA